MAIAWKDDIGNAEENGDKIGGFGLCNMDVTALAYRPIV
jgi:hypothetical protein